MNGHTRILLTLAMMSTALATFVAPAAAQSREDTIVTTAANVLDEIMAIPMREIPQSMLTDAQAVAIIPNVIKGGFVVGVRHGRGVVVIRNADGSWQAPQFITLTGGSVGFQAGLQATDVILVFRTRRSVDGLLTGKFTIGADAAAAAGPVGRQAAVATDQRLRAEIFSYSRSRGLFAGVSLDGSVLEMDPLATAAFYRPTSTPLSPVAQPTIPASAQRLIERLSFYCTRTVQAVEPAAAAAPFVAAPQVSLEPLGGAPVNAQADALRTQVNQSAVAMQPLLDARWQAFLAMPPDMSAQGGQPRLDVMQQTLARYNVVAQGAAYKALNQRPEFQATFAALQQYVAALEASQARPSISLPPPPGQGPTSAPR